MHNKNNNKTSAFIQGLRPFSSSIPKTLKKHLRKGGYNYSNIVDNWTKIVSKKISDACYPITVKMGKEMRDGTMVLNVIHGKEMEVEYEKNEIIGELRSACFSPYFGKVIGIAMMNSTSWNVSQSVKIEINNNTFAGKVCDLPFI